MGQDNAIYTFAIKFSFSIIERPKTSKNASVLK